MEEQRKILVTAALPYANGPIHLGHMVEYLWTDFWVRFQKMRGHECNYFCADDTHGTPISVRAKKEGRPPEEIIAESFVEHQKDFSDFGIEFANYSSTNSTTNRELCETIYQSMVDGKHCETRGVKQAYCEHDKMFLPDRFVRGACPSCGAEDQYGDSCDNCGSTYSPTDLKEPKCSICGNPPVTRESEHVFFKLNNFKDFLKKWVPDHNSKTVTKKLKEWLGDDELRDWDISRDTPYFGFAIPGYKDKFFYVWVDAPMGYIASSKDWFTKKGIDWLDYWGKDSTAEVYHFIGKDIIYFHSLFWPAMLKSAGFRLPTQICVHGFLTVNGQKMSKSKGTFIMARTYLNHLDPSYLRYYFACKLGNNMDDLDLNLEDFVQRVNSDLVGKIINLGSRSAKILQTQFDNRLCSQLDSTSQKLIQMAQDKESSIAQLYENREFAKAIVEIRDIADQANKYFDEQQPWKRVKEDKASAHQSLTTALRIFRILAIYLQPVLPQFSQQVAGLFNEKTFVWSDIFQTSKEEPLQDFTHLMKRVDPKKVEKMVMDSQTETNKSQKKAEPTENHIDIKDFHKLDLRIGEILSAEEVADSDKMMKLEVSLGSEKRTIFSGIKKHFQASELINKKVLVVANLKPRKMKFGTSEGMVLLAGEKDQLFLLTAPEASPGNKVE